MENHVKAQRRDQAHPAPPTGMPEFRDTAGLIAEHGESDARQPTPYHPDHLTRPLGKWSCVSAPVRAIQRSPLVLTVCLRLEAKGSVVTALVEAKAPASLQGFVNDEGEAAASGVEGLHQQRQQTAATLESGPSGAVEHLMVETGRRGALLSRVSQGCRDGAPSAGQQGADEQALDFTARWIRWGDLEGTPGPCYCALKGTSLTFSSGTCHLATQERCPWIPPHFVQSRAKRVFVNSDASPGARTSCPHGPFLRAGSPHASRHGNRRSETGQSGYRIVHKNPLKVSFQ